MGCTGEVGPNVRSFTGPSVPYRGPYRGGGEVQVDDHGGGGGGGSGGQCQKHRLTECTSELTHSRPRPMD